MKGVILAGGLGKRLYPLTSVTNKHLLPVYNKPMIYYPIECLANANIREILLVTGGDNSGDFLKLLGNGIDFGLENLNYAYQKGHGGIADALLLAEHFAGGDTLCVILGDNIIEKNIVNAVSVFNRQNTGAMLLLKEVKDPARFGVPCFENGKIVKIEEKPEEPKSKFAVTGIYFYDNQVFDIIRTLKPSKREELEITDVNNKYIEMGLLEHDILDGWWSDAGTFESLQAANALVAQYGANNIQSGK